jgi:hypothetical protein
MVRIVPYEHLVNRLAQSKPITRAAQLTAYSIIRISEITKKQISEFEKAGGTNKMRQVLKKDYKDVTNILKESLSYDLPQLIKNMIRNKRI